MQNVEDPLFVQDEIPIRSTRIREAGVETITGYTFPIENGVQSPHGFKSHVVTYDKSGMRVRQQKYNSEGTLIHEWRFDSEGRPLEEIAFGASGEVSYRFAFVYSDAGPWVEKRMYLGSGDLHYRIAATRTEDGRIAAATYYDASGRQLRTDTYVYDGTGRLVEVDAGQMGAWIYEYDERNNLKRRTENTPGMSVLGNVVEFEYDDRGLLLRMTHLHYSVTTVEYGYF